MKKWIGLLSAGLIGVATTSLAQQIRIAPEVGINLTKISSRVNGYDNDKNDIRAGLKVGGVVDIAFNSMVSLQPGLFFTQKGAKREYSSTSSLGGISYQNIERYDTRIDYAELPVNLQFYFGAPRRAKFFVGAGPYIAIAIAGRQKYEQLQRLQNGNSETTSTKNEEHSLNIGDNAKDDDIKSTDAGINANLGFITPSGFFLRANAGIGLMNIKPGGDEDNRYNNLGASLSLGFMLGGK